MKRFKMNLQLFAEGDDPGTGENMGDAGQQDPIQPEDQKLDKAFAARLGHEKKKLEAEYTPFKAIFERQAKAAGLSTDEYMNFLEQQRLEEEAEAAGKTPEMLKLEQANKEAQDKLKGYERKEKLSTEEKALVADPKIGTFVKDNIDRIRAIAEEADVSLEVGIAMIAMEKLPDLLAGANPETHIKNYLEGLKKGQKPVEVGGGASTPSPVVAKTFDQARASALEKLKKL